MTLDAAFGGLSRALALGVHAVIAWAVASDNGENPYRNTFAINLASAAPSATSSLKKFTPTGMVATGGNVAIAGGETG